MSVGCSKVWLTAGRNRTALFSTLHAEKERLALGRGNGGADTWHRDASGTFCRAVAEWLAWCLWKKAHFHAGKWNLWALLEVPLSQRRILAGVSLRSYVSSCGWCPAEPEWEKKPNSKLPLHSPSLGELGWCSSTEANCLQRHAVRSKRCCHPSGCLWEAGV